MATIAASANIPTGGTNLSDASNPQGSPKHLMDVVEIPKF